MTLRVLLADDEPLAIERLKVAFRDIPETVVIGAAADGDGAAEAIRTLRPDLVLLDVQMPGMNGLAVAEAVDVEPRPEIVFVTAFEHYAPDAFHVEAADYLLKPVRFERLRQAVERARRRRAQREAVGRAAELEEVVVALRTSGAEKASAEPRYEDEIWVPTRHGLVRVPVDTIDWIEAARDYVMLHTSTRSHILRATMASIEQRLDPALLLRVHRSAFVRLDAVREVRRPGRGLITLVLGDQAEVQVGRNYVAGVQKALKLDPTAAD